MGPFPLNQRTASPLQREQCTAALWISVSKSMQVAVSWGCEIAALVQCEVSGNLQIHSLSSCAWGLKPCEAKRSPVKPRGQCHLCSVTACSGSTMQHSSRIRLGHSWHSQAPGIVNCNCSAGCVWQEWIWTELFPFINSICSVCFWKIVFP